MLDSAVLCSSYCSPFTGRAHVVVSNKFQSNAKMIRFSRWKSSRERYQQLIHRTRIHTLDCYFDKEQPTVLFKRLLSDIQWAYISVSGSTSGCSGSFGKKQDMFSLARPFQHLRLTSRLQCSNEIRRGMSVVPLTCRQRPMVSSLQRSLNPQQWD